MSPTIYAPVVLNPPNFDTQHIAAYLIAHFAVPIKAQNSHFLHCHLEGSFRGLVNNESFTLFLAIIRMLSC